MDPSARWRRWTLEVVVGVLEWPPEHGLWKGFFYRLGRSHWGFKLHEVGGYGRAAYWLYLVAVGGTLPLTAQEYGFCGLLAAGQHAVNQNNGRQPRVADAENGRGCTERPPLRAPIPHSTVRVDGCA
ncbi:hypothetical protein E5D57_014031 [Metarhizium anisopliae]|nr:hypothetical protein E5D57_014031 [Metarhizium anisopliae]